MLIAWIAFAVYLLMPSREFYWDGVGFALAIETGAGTPDSLLHPNHLLYNLMGYAGWKTAALCGLPLRALYLLQACNAAFASAGVYLVWRIANGRAPAARVATWAALLFAFSAQWWRFAADANAYIPAVFFLLLSYAILSGSSKPRPVAVGLAHGAAMLFHQLAIFFLPVGVLGFLFSLGRERERGSKRTRIGDAAKYAAVAGTTTLAAYAAAYATVRPMIGTLGFWDWVTVHATDALFWMNPVHGVRYSLRGTMRLFLGGRVNQLQPGWATIAGALAFLGLLALTARLFLRMRRTKPEESPAPESPGLRGWLRCHRLDLLWIAAYFLFLLFWQPQNTFYRLFYLPPLIFLVAGLPWWRGRKVQLLALLSAIVCVWNFTVAIYPHSRPQANEVLAFASQRVSDWPEGTRIVFANSHSDLWLIEYFNLRAEWVEMPRPDLLALEKGPDNLWLEKTAYDAIASFPGGAAWLERHIDPARSKVFHSQSHHISYFKIKP
jgi:hypothetical protein